LLAKWLHQGSAESPHIDACKRMIEVIRLRQTASFNSVWHRYFKQKGCSASASHVAAGTCAFRKGRKENWRIMFHWTGTIHRSWQRKQRPSLHVSSPCGSQGLRTETTDVSPTFPNNSTTRSGNWLSVNGGTLFDMSTGTYHGAWPGMQPKDAQKEMSWLCLLRYLTAKQVRFPRSYLAFVFVPMRLRVPRSSNGRKIKIRLALDKESV